LNILKSVFKILILIIFIGTAQFSCFKSKYPEIASFLLSAGILRELRDGSGTELMREWDGTGRESKIFKIWGSRSAAQNLSKTLRAVLEQAATTATAAAKQVQDLASQLIAAKLALDQQILNALKDTAAKTVAANQALINNLSASLLSGNTTADTITKLTNLVNQLQNNLNNGLAGQADITAAQSLIASLTNDLNAKGLTDAQKQALNTALAAAQAVLSKLQDRLSGGATAAPSATTGAATTAAGTTVAGTTATRLWQC
jgi:hypothetical protein